MFTLIADIPRQMPEPSKQPVIVRQSADNKQNPDRYQYVSHNDIVSYPMQTLAFTLKKTIGMLLMPFALLWLILLAVWWTLPRNTTAKTVLGFVLAGFFLASYPPVGDRLLAALESRYPPLRTLPSSYRYIVVLGSGHHDTPSLPATSRLQPEAMMRLSEAIRLYVQHPEKITLVFTGYAGKNNTKSHAETMREAAVSLGVPPDHILTLPSPKDTAEEAAAVKKLLGDAPFVLVTSAFHMPRAKMWFDSYALAALPAPAAFHASNENDFTTLLDTRTLQHTTWFVHELLGILWLRFIRHIAYGAQTSGNAS